MGCNCGGGVKNPGARSLNRGSPSGTPRSPSRATPAVPTPTERRLLEMQAQAKQSAATPSAPIGDVRLEQERQRRLAVLRALGHA